MEFFVLFSTLIVATCGLIYELIVGTLASYLLGDSVTQFSLIIGIYLFSMGIGSYLAQGIKTNLVDWFVRIQCYTGLIGGLSAVFLFFAFETVSSFRVILFSVVSIIGILVGIEIPLLMRLLKDQLSFSKIVSRVLAIDYVGALFASLLFPLILVPNLGLIRSALFFGILNLAIGTYTLFKLKNRIKHWKQLLAQVICFFCILFGFLLGADRFTHWLDEASHNGRLVHVIRSPYQKIAITANQGALELYLNGNLQFNSKDEYRYHESLIHPLMQLKGNESKIRDVLVLGGGDGLAVRELLRYDNMKVTLVDLDPEMTKLFQTSGVLTELNQNALLSESVTIINTDAFQYIRDIQKKFDAIFIDFPDPSNHALAKLYSVRFFKEVKRKMKQEGIFAIQSTSPYFARKSFWCIGATIEEAGLYTNPYHAYVPSFGEWGFFLASKQEIDLSFNQPSISLKFLKSPSDYNQLFEFPSDMSKIPSEPNRLYNQRLVTLFEREWNELL